jgi:hypothetical protein
VHSVRPKLAAICFSGLNILASFGECSNHVVKSKGKFIFDASIMDLLFQLRSEIFVVHESRTLLLKNTAPFAKFVYVCSPPFGPSLGAATFAEGTAIAKKFVEDFYEIVVTVVRRSQLGKARKKIILVGVGRGFADIGFPTFWVFGLEGA